MNILITGASGFLGSALIRDCLSKGIHVSAIKRPTSNLWRLEDLAPKVKWCNNDDLSISTLFKQSKPFDAVIHAATNYGRDQNSLSDVIDANLLFPLYLLDKSIKNDVRTFINFDTFFSANATSSSYLNTYSLSKKHFLEYAAAIPNLELISFINLRLYHIYGPKDSPQKFIPKILHAMILNEHQIKLTSGNQTRDFVYVDDVVSACQKILFANLPIGLKYHFDIGSGTNVSIKSLIMLMHTIIESKSELQFGAIPLHTGEILHSTADIGPLNSLGWKPQISLNEGLRKIIIDARLYLADKKINCSSC